MDYKVDYHMHSHFSDGALSPTDLVKRAKDLELQEIAITDHDGIDGIMEGQIAGKALEINVIPGIEIETRYSEKTLLHILGYRFDVKNPELLELIEILKKYRNERNSKLLAELEKLGYKLTGEEMKTYPEQEYICKLVIARAMAKKGYIENPKDAFSDLFDKEPLASIEKESVPVSRVMEVLKGAGATIVWAHPMKTKGIGERGSKEFYENVEKIIVDLKKMGLKGVECYNPHHNEEEALELVILAGKHHLHITTGSDYHG